MKQQIEFSFVMPSYKIRYFREAIDSILNQTYTNFELIIVNDASPENLSCVVASYDDKRIRYYENEINIGSVNLVKNWNLCIHYAQGKYLILASDDDIYMPTFLEEIHELIRKYPQCDIFRSRVQRINAIGDITSIDLLFPEFLSQSEFLYYWSLGTIKCISNYVFNLHYFITNGEFHDFPLAWFSDDCTVIQMSKLGIANSKNILFQFRSSELNISMMNNPATLIKKLYATDLFYIWITDYMAAENLVQFKYIDPSFNIHKYLFNMILKIVSEFSYKYLFFVLKYLFKNKILYKKEKLYIFINFISKS